MTAPARDTRLDSLKGILITLVVIGHMLELHLNESFIRFPYLMIYSFHMPLFIIISGYFFNPLSTFAKVTPGLLKLAETLLVYQVLRCLILLKGGELTFVDIIKPHWVLWYILSLSVWRAATPMLFKKCGSSYAILLAVSIVASLLSGLIPLSNELSFQRTFTFYPCFVIGMWLKESEFHTAASFRKLTSGAIVIVLISIVLLWCFHILTSENLRFGFYANHSYSEPSELIRRVCSLAIGVAIAIPLFATLPDIPLFAALGRATMPVYILHVYFIDIIDRRLIETGMLPSHFCGLLLYALAIVGLLWLFSRTSLSTIAMNPISHSAGIIKQLRAVTFKHSVKS